MVETGIVILALSSRGAAVKSLTAAGLDRGYDCHVNAAFHDRPAPGMLLGAGGGLAAGALWLVAMTATAAMGNRV
jgi:hypothetical protein